MGTTGTADAAGRRRGFSLVELIIIVAILGLLAGILLTSLQAARETSRRMTCAANLRQLGAGIALHHDARGVLPPSRGGPDSTATFRWGSPPVMKPYPRPGIGRVSGFVMLLPFIGEEAIYSQIEAAGWPWVFHPIYQSATIPLLLCPSDVSARSHNYLFSIGDRYRDFMTADPGPVAQNAEFQAKLRGLFGVHSRVRLASVRDGTSKTIAMSECVKPDSLGRVALPSETIAGVQYYGLLSEAVVNNRFAVARTYNAIPAQCLAAFSQTAFRPGTTLAVMDRSPGWWWSNGRTSDVSFSTVLPPNGPRCGDDETCGSLTPQSRHPGGVLGLMADGAVRFISDDIDAGDPNLPDRQSGPSPYGVWGALGSRAGGEVVAVPSL